MFTIFANCSLHLERVCVAHRAGVEGRLCDLLHVVAAGVVEGDGVSYIAMH